MKLNRRFTQHSRERIKTRCNIPTSTITNILDSGKCINLGNKNSSFARLFYCIKQHKYFVIIQDTQTFNIVTVLEASMKHEWTITENQKTQAMLLAWK